MPRIAIIPGDGIGVEVVDAATVVLRSAGARYGVDFDLVRLDMGAERYLSEGITITEDEFQDLATGYDAIFLGALGDPRVPEQIHARDILLGLRFRLDLYVNFRPCVLLSPELCPLRDVDPRGIRLEIFRENTEGLYVNLGGTFKQGTPDEVAIQEMLNTRKGVERIIRAAFEFARDRGREKVTLVDKANAMPIAGGLWRRTFAEVAAEFSGIATDAVYVDAMAMDLVRRPEEYSVIVTSNLFGDILSDLAAELTGGLGLAPSANIHPGRHALFEPVHGSAPDIAGQGIANPLGAIRCTALIMEHLEVPEAAAAIESAVQRSVEEGFTTPDLGGGRTTEEVGQWIGERVAEVPQ